MSGGTTTDDTAAGQARTSTAPNQQDLQATIAPQLTTTGADAATQQEIPEGDEATPHHQVRLLDEILCPYSDVSQDSTVLGTYSNPSTPIVTRYPQDEGVYGEIADSTTSTVWSQLDDEVIEYISTARTICESFIVQGNLSLEFKKYPTTKFLPQNQQWIGKLLPSAA